MPSRRVTSNHQQLQVHFVALHNADTGSMPDFWKQLAKDKQLGKVIPQLQLNLQFGAPRSNNRNLTVKLIS